MTSDLFSFLKQFLRLTNLNLQMLVFILNFELICLIGLLKELYTLTKILSEVLRMTSYEDGVEDQLQQLTVMFYLVAHLLRRLNEVSVALRFKACQIAQRGFYVIK